MDREGNRGELRIRGGDKMVPGKCGTKLCTVRISGRHEQQINAANF